MTLRRLLSSLALLGTVSAPTLAHAVPLVIDGAVPANTTCAPADQRNGGRACELGGVQEFDSVVLRNGAVLFVTPYNGNGDKSATGNLTLKSTSSITIDRSSRIEAKGRGYQRALCSNGPGPAAFPDAGGKGGCAVRDSGGGAAHVGPGGRGTKDNPAPAPSITGFEEACASTFSGGTCIGDLTSCRNGDALPSVAGVPFYHHILTPEFGPAGGDKGCGDGDGRGAADVRGGSGGGRVVLFAANAAQTGLLRIEGRVSADGNRGCSQGNDSAGGGAGGTILLVGDTVEVSANARVSAHGGRGGDSQPKCLPCTVDTDCERGNGHSQTCQQIVDPATGVSAGRCGPCNCSPCSTNAQCRTDLGQTCKNIPGAATTVCADASNQCTPLDPSDNEIECRATQNDGTTCDDCGGAGGGGLINVLSRLASLHPEAIFDVRGAFGGICPICTGEAGGGEGELQIDGAYVGEICDGFDNDFNGTADDNLPMLTCAGGVQIPSCVGGKPQECPADVPSCKTAVTDTRPRFAVVLDTSGSMLLDLKGNPTFGDGSEGHLGLDTNADAGSTNGNDSRLFIAKRALGNVFAAFPESDYALARYYQDASLNRSCQTANWFECASNCCSYDDPTNNIAPVYSDPNKPVYPGNRCNLATIYPTAGYDAALNVNASIGWPAGNTADCINYAGTCGPPERGAQFVTDFNSPLQNHLMWLDNHERGFDPGMKSGEHCSWRPDNLTDCELRATGPTPLAGSLAAAQAFLQPIVQCDGAVPCRKYATILLTDGAESCQGNPVAAATALRNSVPGAEIKTYVIGFAVGPGEVAGLNAIAAAGGTTTAFVASNEAELANALAAIIAGSTVFETCNGADDDCDGLVDEDFPEKGQVCDDGKKGVCKGTGAFVCTADGKGTECVITTPGQAPVEEVCDGVDNDCDGIIDEGDVCKFCVPQLEVCDGKDNDCDGMIDETPVDVGKPCGLDIGICKPGLTACTAGKLTCEGGVAPGIEICNGIDDNCDNVVDGLTETCYSGPAGTQNVGVCRSGTKICTAVAGSGVPTFGACVGEVFPTAEVCDGLDNDCDGTIDDAIQDGLGHTTGDVCCPFGDKCGIGACKAGSYQCAGSAVLCGGGVGPSVETCDGIDNDCNGKVDDLPGLGSSCKLPGGCAGTLACDPVAKQVICASGMVEQIEICNGLDDNCNGQIDEEPEVSQNDKSVGVDCDVPAAPQNKGQCKGGKTVCKNGVVTCQGSIKPTAETCDGVDSDCDGAADNQAPCPAESKCVQGICAIACAPGEFPCPGGYTCVLGACIPLSCDGVVCQPGFGCKAGVCVAGAGGSAGASGAGGAAAGGKGGAAGSGVGGQSQAGAAGTSAGAGASGNGTGGNGTSGSGTGGNGTSGNGTGGSGTSGNGTGGTTGSAGTKAANDPNDDRISLATGGGGFVCSTSAPGRSSPGALVAALGLAIVVARRARLGQKGARLAMSTLQTRHVPQRFSLLSALLALGGLGLLVTAGCDAEGYCWEGCDEKSNGLTGGASGSGGAAGRPQGGAAGNVGLSGNGGSINNGGAAGTAGKAGAGGATCKDTQTDVNNCGKCGNVCVIAGGFPKCVAGACVLDTCAPGRTDLDKKSENGCEYACIPSGAEVCDNKDNDCDGQVDEGIDLQTDPNNCGVCGVKCDLANANSACKKGVCVIDSCKAGFGDADKLPTDGCEYICPVNPPTAEVCDDIDNDCDGEVNNGNPGGGVSCDDSCPSGDCKGECGKGVTLCAGTKVVCVPGSGPKLEICDGKDNDCDGVDDNGFDKQVDPLNCGTCGNVCTGANAVGGCVAGACVIATCLPGFRDNDAQSENGCEYKCPQTPPGIEVCNGVDDDCNGIVDDADLIAGSKPQDTFCNTRAGTPCEGATVTCQGTLGWRCGYKTGAELDASGDLILNETKCDGQDGNCNGQVDEPFTDLGTGCDNGLLGACRDAGIRACDPADPSKTLCDLSPLPNPVPSAPSTEICNAVDDDCDGQTDEGITFDMVEITVGGSKVLVDRYEASRPDATAASAGLNEDRSCVRAGVLPWGSANYAEALAACTATGRRLCTATELMAACDGGVARVYPYGDTYDGATCNGLDHDGVAGGVDDNTLLASGALAQCKTPTTEIFDLSGNLAEWTSTQTGTTGAPSNLPIHQLQGGSFLSPELGTRCGFALARLSTNAILDSVGFRCCQDVPLGARTLRLGG